MIYKAYLKVIILLLTVLLVKCEKEANVNEDYRIESEHFLLISRSDDNSIAEMESVRDHAEVMYQRIVEIIGAENASDMKITILLKGDFESEGPKFDPEGIHLYRYSNEENGYNSLLTHEIGHAIREQYYIDTDPYKWPGYPYYDEAFAEYIAQLVEPDKKGFPFYAFPEDVVVGYFLLTDKAIDHHVLRTRHFELNQQCNTQAYPLRASWIRFFDLSFGREKFLDLIYTDEAPNAQYIESLTGTTLDTIDTQWSSWVLDRYDRITDASVMAEQYVEKIASYTYCIE